MATEMAVPVRTLQQRMVALEKANATRSYRKDLKRQIMSGERRVSDVLTQPRQYELTMPVFDALVAVRGWGRVKVQKMMRAAGIAPSKTIGGLSERQRHQLGLICRSR